MRNQSATQKGHLVLIKIQITTITLRVFLDYPQDEVYFHIILKKLNYITYSIRQFSFLDSNYTAILFTDLE